MSIEPLQKTFWQRAFDATLTDYLKFNSSSRKLFAVALLLTNDAADNGVSAGQFLSQMRKMLANRELMVTLFHLINEIDDIVDEMDPDCRLQIGEAKEGNKPCEFLRNTDVCVPAYDQTLSRISEAGLLTYEEEAAFSNLYAVLIREGARAEKTYLQTGSVRSRQSVTEANLRLAEVVGVHVLQHCVGAPSIRELSQNRGLYYGDVKHLFPKASRLSRMAEMIDDMGDLLLDLEHEVETGITSPNSVLCRMHENGDLYGEDRTLTPGLKSFLARHSHNPQTIMPDQYPEALRNAIDALKQEYFTEAFKFNPVHRDLMITWWRVTENDGLRSSVHPDVVFKRERHAREAAEATAKLEASR